MRISFFHHDNPTMLSDWRIRNMALQAARIGKSASYHFAFVEEKLMKNSSLNAAVK